MSNVYGFDFLRAGHTLDDQQDAVQSSPVQVPLSSFTAPPQAVTHKSDLEKQHDVIKFLKNHRSSGCLQPGIIYDRLGVDLSEGGDDEEVRKMLLSNQLIKVEEEPDPENPSLTILTFGYLAKFNNVRNKTGLLAQINKSKYGVRRLDLLDSYEGVEHDISALITGGEIIAIPNSEDKNNYILFQRGEPFFVELDGHLTVPPSAYNNPFMIETNVNAKKQIRRGEAIWVGGQWFRVSSAVKEGVTLSEQPPRAHAPLSATSYKDLSKKNDADGYVRDFTERSIPLDHPLLPETSNRIQRGKQALAKLLEIVSTGGQGVTGKASKQKLLSSNATSDNYETLAENCAIGQGSNSARRRPTNTRSHFFNPHHGLKKKATSSQIEELTKASKDPTLIYCHPRRHGCTLDVRDLYLKTKNEIPLPDKELEIFNLMVKHKLLDKNSKMKRPRMSEENKNLDKDGKPMKRRYYIKKSDQLRNDHLKDTALGDLIQAALDKQQQGKSVGDGGM